MPILNYTTKVNAFRTVNEIQQILIGAKARAVLIEYDDEGVPTSISFKVDTKHGLMSFRMSSHADGVYAVMQNENVDKKYKTLERSHWIAWRIVKDWIEAEMARINSGQAEMAEVFLAYAQNEAGTTIYDTLVDKGFPQLTHGVGGL